jgi:hypothetical protein
MRSRTIWGRVSLVVLCSLGVVPAVASAKTTATLKVAFAPDVAGASTTVTFTAAFKAPEGAVPAPITKSITHLPPGLEIQLGGVSTCSLKTLELEEPGAGDCPAASLLGAGTSFAEAGLGGEPIQEHAPVTAVLGSSRPGHILIYLDAEGTYPITEQVIAKATLTGSAATGQTFTINVPPILTDPGGPDASVLDFTMSLGRQKVLSLLRHRHGRGRGKAAPARGIVLPSRCHGKLAFPTELFFKGQGPITVDTSLPCPRR